MTSRKCLVRWSNLLLSESYYLSLYQMQPLGYVQYGPNGEPLVCRLTKAVYGLRQAPRAWFDKLKQFFVSTRLSYLNLMLHCLLKLQPCSSCIFWSMWIVETIFLKKKFSCRLKNKKLGVATDLLKRCDQVTLETILGLRILRK